MRPNVLLVVLDSVRARNCSLYGHHNETTPFLSEFAADAVTYTEARSPSLSSLPSHASLFTGYHAAEHNIGSDGRLRPETSFWEQLRDTFGYATAAFTANPFFQSNRRGFLNGFETAMTTAVDVHGLPFPSALDPRSLVDRSKIDAFRRCLSDSRPVRSLVNAYAYYGFANRNTLVPPSLRIPQQVPDPAFVDQFLSWEAEQDGPWAGFVNLMDAHYPYRPGAENHWGDETLLALQDDWHSSPAHNMDVFRDGERPWWHLQSFEALYDGAIRNVDRTVRTLIETLDERGTLRDTLIVITADHGEAFGEVSDHDPDTRLAGHSSDGGIHESVVHVPLICRFPGGSKQRVIDRLASTIHLPEFVLDVVEGGADDTVFCTQQAIVSVDRASDTDCLAVYEQDAAIHKYARYGESIISTVVSRQSSSGDRSAAAQLLSDVESQFTRADVSERPDTELSGHVKNSLRELGYI